MVQCGLKAGNILQARGKKEENHGTGNESNTKMQIQGSYIFAGGRGCCAQIQCQVFQMSLLPEILCILKIKSAMASGKEPLDYSELLFGTEFPWSA